MRPELLRSTPRPVRLTAAGVAVTIVAVAMLGGGLGFGVFLYTKATRDAARSRQLESEGVLTRAEVVEVRRTEGKSSRRLAIYEYEVEGRSYRGRARAPRNVRAGSEIEVRYLPSDPGRSWLPGRAPQGVPLWALPLTSFSFWLAGAVILFAVRHQRRMLEQGRAAEARVTGSKRVHHGEHATNRVQFEFRLLSGAMRTGHFDSHRRPPTAGSTLTILYDPENPKRTAVYPLKLVRTA